MSISRDIPSGDFNRADTYTYWCDCGATRSYQISKVEEGQQCYCHGCGQQYLLHKVADPAGFRVWSEEP